MYNAFRVAGDFSHLLSFVILIYSMVKRKTAKGISLKSQILYLVVFLSRYLDVFHFRHSLTFGQLYNTTFKITYIGLTGGVIYLLMVKNPWKKSYEDFTKDRDTVKLWMLIVPALVLGIITSSRWRGISGIMETLWTMSIWLEAVTIVPQLVVLYQGDKEGKTAVVDALNANFVVALGAYRALYILNWVLRKWHESHYWAPVAWIAGIIQTGLYIDFFYHYFKAYKANKAMTIPQRVSAHGGDIL
jgi:ER lumen protein retaining receptor